MRWATRAAVHIDPAASAWLIGWFIDPGAVFVFVSGPDDAPQDATPFDMPGVEMGHHGAHCTFETLLARHELSDPVLWRIGEIVHEADLDDGRFDAPEAAGLDAALRGLSMFGDDGLTIRVTGPLFGGLYELFRRELFLGRPPA
jgi:hypothetical protein